MICQAANVQDALWRGSLRLDSCPSGRLHQWALSSGTTSANRLLLLSARRPQASSFALVIWKILCNSVYFAGIATLSGLECDARQQTTSAPGVQTANFT